MNRVFLYLFVFWFFAPAYGAVIEAPALSFDYNQNPPSVSWKHITTEHFDIIFEDSVEASAQRVAHLLETAYPYVTRSLGEAPGRIPLILQNQSTMANGFVTLAPRRSEWYMTPSVDPELTNTEWLKTLSLHEFRHAVQFEKGRRGFNRAFRFVLGQIGQAVGLALTLPPWFFEGDAVGIETALSRGGRGRLPLFDRDLRTILLSGQQWSYDKAHLGSYRDYVPNHYYYGYFYTSWLRNQYGDLFLSEVANDSADTSWNPLSYYNSQEQLTGESFEVFYERVIADLLREWKKRADALHPTPYEVKSTAPRFGWTNYYYPQGYDGGIVALKRGLSFIDRFVLLDGKKEETLFYPGTLMNEYPFKVRGGRLAIVERELDPRWGYRDFSRIKVFDLKTREFVLDKRRTKARLAVLDHAGEKLLLVNWGKNQDQSIVVLDPDGKALHALSVPVEDVITSIDWLDDHSAVAVIKSHDDVKSIQRIDLTTGERRVLLNAAATNIGYLAVEEGQILYESPESGIDNLYLLTSEGPRQLTTSLFGAYAPEFHQGKLLYNDYSAAGMNVVTKSLSWETEQRSQDSFYPVYEKFAKAENFPALEEAYQKKELREVKPYSQPGHAINLHSWVLLAPPLSNTLTLIGLSRDVLNKLTLSAGGEYNLNEGTLQGFTGAAWTHWYPVIDLKASYGNRKQTIRTTSGKLQNKWEEGTFDAGVSVPWKYIQGPFLHSFTMRAFSRLIKVTNKAGQDVTEVRDGALLSPGAELSYAFTKRLARRDINPELGVTLDGRHEEGQDITGKNMKGSLDSFDARLFLPGPWYHHSFSHQFAYERQRDRSYQYSSLVFYPRGTRNVFLEEFTKYSGNYLMPLWYPDWNLSRYYYLKRLTLNLFYDELSGRTGQVGYLAASTGWELTFESYFARLLLPINIGVRGSYIIKGLERKNNYEVFLASTLGTF